MSETKYCYKCHCQKNKDVKMIYYPGRSYLGTYVCPECGYTVDKKSYSDDKYA